MIDAYKAMSSALVLLQSSVKSLKIDPRKCQRLNSSTVTQVLQSTLFYSHPCIAVMACSVAPELASFPQSQTALSYATQIREHILRKVRKGQLNRDLAGQTIETIAQELSIMQQKLDQQYASIASHANMQE